MSFTRYYPLSRVKTGLSTNGNLYTLNGKPYRGLYYITYTGDAYTGRNPATGPNNLLTPVGVDRAISNSNVIRRSTNLTTPRLAPKSTITIPPPGTRGLKQLTPAYPEPTEDDYRAGYFKRYFAKKVNIKGYIMEISYSDWATKQGLVDYEDYEVTDLLWQLTGPTNDKRISQYQIKGGVYDTNKRITENKAKAFPGLVEYIGNDYTKFARIID